MSERVQGSVQEGAEPNTGTVSVAAASAVESLARWSVDWEGSTRVAGLIRVFLAMILWARFGRDNILFWDLSWSGLACSAAFFATSTAMLLGVRARWSTAAAGLVALYMVYVVGPTKFEPWTHHHTTLLAHVVCLCALTPCDRSYSLDRWWALRRAELLGTPIPTEWGPLWGIRLLQLQLCFVYAFTAFDKLSAGFLSGARLAHIIGRFYVGSVLPIGAWFDAACAVAACSTVVLEAALAVGLFSTRARRMLLPLGLMLHAAFYVTLDVWTYSATVYALYLAFLDPSVVHRAIDRLQGHASDRLGGP